MSDSPLPSKRQRIFLNNPIVRTPSGTRQRPMDPGEFTGRGMAEGRSTYEKTKMEVISRMGNSGPSDDPLINKLLSEQYRIDAMLGKGGMGAVYLAEDTSTGLPVAVKVVIKENEKLIERFQRREAPALVELSRVKKGEEKKGEEKKGEEEDRGESHIVRVLDFGIHEENSGVKYPYLVMEYLDGQDLRQMLKEQGRLKVDMVRDIGAQICSALIVVHEKKIIHRDLKPANIFLIRRDKTPTFVKLLDFGLAKFEGAADIKDSFLTSEGLPIMGTPHYQSPEQAWGTPMDSSSDIFSIGIVLYEMLTGKLPFEGNSLLELSTNIQRYPPTSMIDLCPDIPRELNELIIDGALSKTAGGRPSARVLMNALMKSESLRMSMERTIGEDFQEFSARRPSDPVKRNSGRPVADQNRIETQEEAAQIAAPEKSGGAAKTVGVIALVGAVAAGAVYGYINRDKISEFTGMGRPAASAMASNSANPGANASSQAPAQARIHKVTVTSDPKGAIVKLQEKDGKMRRLGHTLNPLDIELPPGKQTIILVNIGFPDRKVEITPDVASVQVTLSNGHVETAHETPDALGPE